MWIGRFGAQFMADFIAHASTLGWIYRTTALWAAFWAIDVSMPFSVMPFVVPMGALASITPLPGAGGIGTVPVATLVNLPGVAGRAGVDSFGEHTRRRPRLRLVLFPCGLAW